MESILETLEKRRIRPSSDIQPHEFLYAWNGKPMCARGESAIREINLANGYKQYENAQQTKLVF